MLSKEDLIKGAHKTTVVSTEKSTPTLSKTELIQGSYPKRAFTSADANQITTFYDTLSAYDKKYKSSNSTWGGIIKSNFDTYRNNGANFLEQIKDLEDIKTKASALQYMLKTTDFGSGDVGFFNLSGKAQVAKNEETKKQILDDINAMLKGENNIDTTINQLNNNYKIVNHNKASNEVSKFYNLLEKANQEGDYSYGNAQKTAEEKANIYTEIKAQAPIVKDAIQNLMIDDEQKNAMLDTIDEIINGENNIDTIIKSFEDMSDNYAQMSYDEFNKYEQAKYYSSAEYATEMKEKAHIVKLYENMLDRYERSKWDDEIKRNNLKPGEAVVDIYSAGDELEEMGISSKFLYEDLPKGVSPEKLLSVFEEKLYAKYNQLKGEVDSYEWYTDIDSAVESYKNGKNTAYNKWIKDGSKDYSADLDDDYKKLENAPDVEWAKEAQNNYNEKFIGKLSEDERLVYNVKMHNARSDKERERITREFQEVINQRNAYETAESLKGHEWLSTLYSIYSGLGNWATGIKRFITGDETTTEGEYASGMVRQNLKETHGNAWASVYDVGSSVGQQLPSIGLALLTKGASNLIGKSVAQAKSLSGVVSASKLDKIAKISNTIGSITYKTAFGSSVAGNAYAEMKRAGYTETEAKTYALLSAASEVFLQDALGGIGSFSGKLTNKSINALVSNIDNAALRIATSGFIRAGGEFFEEALQEVLNPVYKTIITMDENIEPINWGDVLYSGALGSLTSIAMSAPSNIATGTKYGFNTIKKIGYSLTDKGIKNLSVSNELYEFANSMPEYTLSNKMAQIVRKKGNAYNMLSELAHINKPLTTEQITTLHDRLIEDGYSEEIANTIVDSAVKVSQGKSIPKIQKTAIESNTILSPAILDSIVQADSKMLGITEQYNNLYEDATPARNAVYENITNKIMPKAETAQKATQTAEKAPTTTKTENTTTKGRETLKAPKNTNTKKISDVVLKSTARNPLTAEQISDNEAIIQGIAKRMGGYEVIFSDENYTDENGVSAPGRIDTANKKIHINRNAKNPITWLFKHEMTHSTEFKKHYGKFVESIQKADVYKDWLRNRTGMDSSRQNLEAAANLGKMLQYSEQGVELGVTGAQAENIADFVADMLFTDPNGLNTLLNQLETSQRNKVAQWLLDVIESIKSMFRGKQLREINALERKLRKLVTETKTVKTTDESKSAESVKHSLDEDAKNKKISVDMTDTERTEILKNKTLTVPIYKGQADTKIQENAEKLNGQKRDLIQKVLIKIAEDFNAFGKYNVKDFDIEVSVSKSNLNESITKKATPTQIAKLLPIVQDSLQNAIGIETHINRYFYDNNTIAFANLLSGYVDNDIFIPIRFGVKLSANSAKLYIVVDENPIKKIKVDINDVQVPQKVSADTPTSTFKASISKIFSFVNNKDLLRYIPDDMLNNEQKQAKQEAIAETIEYTNDKNDRKYKDFIAKGDKASLRRMILAAAKLAGYTGTYYHGSPDKFTVFDKKKARSSGTWGKGFYFTKSKSHANQYGNSFEVYLNLGNVMKANAETLTNAEIRKLIEAVAENEDFSIENYGTYDVNKILSTFESKDAFDVLVDLNTTAIGDFAEALKLFNEVLDKNYTSVETDLETVVYNPEQIKSADPVTYDDNGKVIPLSERFNTENEDIRYSLEENETRPLKDIIADIGKNKIVSSEAEKAYKDGYMPKSLWTKEMLVYGIRELNPKIDATRLSLEKLQTFLKNEGTYQTGKIPRNTDFYGIDENVVKNLTQTKVDNLETNTEDFTLESQSANPSDQSSEYAEQMDSLGAQLRSGQITLDDYKNAIDSLYKEAGQKHGTIKQGESVTGEENFNNPVPQSVGKGTKVRQTVRTIMEAPKNADISDVLDPALKAKIVKGELSYVPTSNKENIAIATTAIANGADYSTWYEKINGRGILKAEDIALGELLLQGALEQGDAGKALKLTAELSEVGTRLGQAVQAFSLLKRMGGLGKLMYVQQAVRTINRDLQMRFGNKKTTPQVKLKEDLAVQLAESKTESDFDIAYTAMLQDIASQIPSTFRDKWNAWRYMAMLANPTTIIRNFTGNVLFMPTMMISNTMSKTAQLFIKDTQKRTRAFTVPKRYKEFAEKSWQENRKALMSGGKYNMSTEIDDYRTIFKLKSLESVRKATNWALENKWFGDEAFMGNHYRRALGEVLAARKVDLTNISKKTLAEAEKIAAERALKATYRDATVVAQALNMLSNQRGWGILVEGVIPFKKTPINILKRGVEYSPLGLLNGVGKAFQLATKKGDMSATTVIDAFSNALTGTGLFILGMWFSSMGIASAGFDDEDELWRKLKGEQEYSLKFGDLYYTFDWMAPSSIPFFMGVSVYEDVQRKTNESVGLTELVKSAAASGIDVMLETSMLQSVSDLLSNFRFAESSTEGISNILASDISSFIMQHFPTLLGKMANTLDDTRREFFIDKSKGGVGQFFDTLGEKISAKIPWLSDDRLPYVNAWGEEESTGSVGKRIFQNFVSPGYISWDKSTELTDEISRLYKNTGNAKVLPERAPKKIKFKDTTKVLTEDEYYDYSTRRGQKNADYLEELIAHKDYASLSDEQKAEIIEKLYKFSDAYAKSYLDYTYDDIVLMDIVDIDKATYDGYSKQTKTALAKAFFLKSYGDEMKIERNGGSVVDEYIKESIKKAGTPKKEKKKENVDNVIKNYS